MSNMRTSNLALAVAVILAGCMWYIYHLGGERATLRMRLHASDSTIAALRAPSVARDTIYRIDTLRYRVAVDRWKETARWDTVTIQVPAETVKTIIREANTALNACSVVVQTCEQRVATRDSLIRELQKREPLIANRPSVFARLRDKAVPVFIGAGLGYFAGSRQ